MKFGMRPVVLQAILCDECGKPVRDAEWDQRLILGEEFAREHLDSIYVEEMLNASEVDDRLICHRHETHWCEKTDALALGTHQDCPHQECHS